MKAIGALLVLVSVNTNAQQLPTLTPPVALDVRVQSVVWHPHVKALLYTRTEQGGLGIGAFAPGDLDGGVLLHINSEDAWEFQWFESAPVATVIVYSMLEKDLRETTIYLLDAKARTIKTLYKQETSAKDYKKISVETSPAFVHAIYSVQTAKGRAHYVLPISGKKLVASRDLDDAESKGISGPTWSVDGTAIYAQGDGSKVISLSGQSQDETLKLVARTIEIRLEDKIAEGFKIEDGNWTVKLTAPVPPLGSSVLELMPANPVLRPVRFKGAWESKALAPIEFEAAAQSSELEFGLARGRANSLWLKRGDQALLVAANAGQVWMAPRNLGVAFLVDGALMVRMIAKP